jgi:hypothetical protein
MTNYLQQEQRKTIISWVALSLLTLGGTFLLAYALVAEVPQRAYEYETTSGEKGEAKYCGGRGKTYCQLDDGTIVVDIKQYKKVYKEDEE